MRVIAIANPVVSQLEIDLALCLGIAFLKIVGRVNQCWIPKNNRPRPCGTR